MKRPWLRAFHAAAGGAALLLTLHLPPALAQAIAAVSAPPPVSVISHGQFDKIQVLRPSGTIQQFVVLFTGGEQPSTGDRKMAATMVARGAMVALVPLPPFYQRIMADSTGSQCVYGGGSVENFARYVQAKDQLQTYIEPLLVGTGDAAAFVYGLLVQAPADTFTGALSVGFCPRLPVAMKMCVANELKSVATADGKAFDLGPASKLVAPWTAMQAGRAACTSAAPAVSTAAFVQGVPKATWIASAPTDAVDGMPAGFEAAYDRLATARAPLGSPPAQLSDLPVVEVPVGGPGKRFAVLISGDGGWAAIDKRVAAALQKDGVPVVGVDSLRYFWTARTPEGMTADMDRVIRYYAARWQRSEVLLIGYSQGADVLPFIWNRLPQRTRDSIKLNVLLAPGHKAAFEFHVANWLGKSGDKPIAPEAKKMSAANTLCVYGTDEKADSLCPVLDASNTRVLGLPGGHHLSGDYEGLAAQILGAVPK